ncbi:MAG TPA: HAMP domain-containing sensor histidine kinase [Nitrolancea sp.]
MFKSLRARILISHLAVIMLVFSLTFVVAFIPVRNVQTHLEIRRLEDYSAPVVVQTGFALNRPALMSSVNDILDIQAKQLKVRLILLDQRGEVLHDTKSNDPLSAETKKRLYQASLQLLVRVENEGTLNRLTQQDRDIYVGKIGGQRALITIVSQVEGRYVAIIAPTSAPLFRELILPLLLALGIALLGAVIATVFLSRSIALPITRLTRAADGITGGDLNRTVPEQGNGEVGQLVHSFNEMIRRLRITYESQRRLLANVAHELRTPLTSIQGYAQGLSDGIFETEQQRKEALETIGHESERVNELLIQILELARLESGQSGPQRHEIDVDDIVARVLRRHRVEASTSGVELIGPVSGARTIVADEAMVDQAIDNLVRNAIRHTPDGGSVAVGLATTRDAERNAAGIRISVTDTGSGIPEDAIPHIFDRFYRANGHDTSNTRFQSGFGLGLAIVREIAVNHGGTVNVTSEIGKGTTFTIDLPSGQTRQTPIPRR